MEQTIPRLVQAAADRFGDASAVEEGDVQLSFRELADASVQASNLLVVTGKTFGVTNIIALDQQGNVIQDQRVIVQRDTARMVNLHKGSQRQSFTCAPECTPTVTIGDDKEYFAKISEHAKRKTSFSSGQSDGSGGAQ